MTGEYHEVRGRGVAAFVRETGRDEYWRMLAAQRATYLGDDGRARPELIEELPCAACGTDAADEVFWKDGFRYVRCRECGSLYVSPQLEAEHLDAYWSHSPVAAHWAKVLAAPAQVAFDRAKYVSALEWVEGLRGGPGGVLDVGCATGLFLEVARERGWRITGVEPGRVAREEARARGLPVAATLSDVRDGPYDVVSFWEVVEHTKAPREVLVAAGELLAADGVVMTLVGGNAHAFANRVMRAASAAFDFSRLWYFSPHSFDVLLHRAGFEQFASRSVIAEIDTTMNYLRYDDPYAPVHEEEVLPPALLAQLEAAVLEGDLGYKFLSLASRPGRASAAADTN